MFTLSLTVDLSSRGVGTEKSALASGASARRNSSSRLPGMSARTVRPASSGGAFAAYVLYRCAHLPIARRGLKLVLGIYFVLMIIHAVTGFSALGWRAPEVVLAYFAHLHQSVFSFFI